MKSETLFLGFVLVFSGGCAFKQPEPTIPGPPTPTYKVGVNWNLAAPAPRYRDVILDAGVLKAHDPVTLPPEVPSQIDFSINLPPSLTSEGIGFAVGVFQIGSLTHSVPIQILPEQAPDASRISFRTLGMDSLMPKDKSATGSLRVDFFDASQKLFSFAQDLRTPAAAIEIQGHGPEDFTHDIHTVSIPRRLIEVGQSELNLVYTFDLSNHETLPVAVDFPRVPEGQFAQLTTRLSYRDIGCNGPGFSIDANQAWNALSTQLVLLPLRGDLLSEAGNTLSSPTTTSDMQVALAPEESIRLGVFAIGAGASSWNAHGPQGSDTSNPTVPSDCYQVCTEYTQPDHPGGCGHGCGIEYFSVPPASCAKWETRRNSTSITVGIQRSDIEVQFSAQGVPLQVRYSDLDFTQDPQSRILPIPQLNTEIQWVPVN